MLIEINCNKFRQNPIRFQSGLNIILGDEAATNSIGKSTLLMVIDFVFGGSAFKHHNKDVIDELGEHTYFFHFIFDGKAYHFGRSTDADKEILICNEKYDTTSKMSLSEYKSFLQDKYVISENQISFRTVAGLFSRIWGRDNYDVKQPLHNSPKQKAAEAVYNLMRIFKKHGPIEVLKNRLTELEHSKTILLKAGDFKYIPKIGKKEYTNNIDLLESIKAEIKDIKKQLSKYAYNISEIANREIFKTKIEKDKLISLKYDLENKIARIKRHLKSNKYFSNQYLNSLADYFPSINVSKFAEIEEFHSGINVILKAELKAAEKQFMMRLNEVNESLEAIDRKITNTLKNIDKPEFIIDKVFDLSVQQKSATTANEYYEKKENLNNAIATASEDLSQRRQKILKGLENGLNEEMRTLNDRIQAKGRKPPILKLEETRYTFSVFEDTGTGKAYVNLIILDLAIFRTTNIPFLIHDSLLFKNIENSSIENLFKEYSSSKKQIFASIDEIGKYGQDFVSAAAQKVAIRLSDSQVLYTKDWRK